MKTTSADKIKAGDVVIAPDGTRHTVTEAEHHFPLDLHHFATDTGIAVTYRSNFTARRATYDIEGE